MTFFNRFVLGVVGAATLCVFAAPAGAATTIGNTERYAAAVSKCNNRLSIGADPTYVAAASGVVVSYRINPAATGGQVAFKVVRNAPALVTVKGTSPLSNVTATGLQTRSVRVPIEAGDSIAVWGTGNFDCQSQTYLAFEGPTDYLDIANPAVGFSGPKTSSVSNQRTLVAATIEADADRDGFGDETQDACLGTAGPNNGCAVSITRFCKVPSLKGKTKSAAIDALKRADCKLGKAKKKKLRKFTKKQRRNRVRSQSRPAGSVVLAGAAVDITINVKKK